MRTTVDAARVAAKEESFMITAKQEAVGEGVMDAAVGPGPEMQSPAGRSKENEATPGPEVCCSKRSRRQDVDLEMDSTDGVGEESSSFP